jgi:hypothetical protein
MKNTVQELKYNVAMHYDTRYVSTSIDTAFAECHGRVVTLLIRIWEVSGSNLASETGYPGRYVVVFLSPSRQLPR